MNFRFIVSMVLMLSISSALFSQDAAISGHTVSYEEYIAAVERNLPELKSNEINVLSAENSVKSAKSGGDTAFTAGGNLYSNKEYAGINSSGDAKGYNFFGGLSKTITSTGTTVTGTYNYAKDNYSNFSSTSSNYSAYSPSMSVTVSQPLLYNFLGKVDRFAENNAEMKLEIAKYQLMDNNRSVLNSYRKLYFQWIVYKKIIQNLDEAIANSNLLKEQIKRKVSAGLADNDDYQGAVASVLNYQNQRREYSTMLKSIENRMRLYLDINQRVPDEKFFNEYYQIAGRAKLDEIGFSKTTSSRIMNLTMKNYVYSKGVYENRLLPELNVYAGVTKKDISESQTYGGNDTDYNVGFKFKYYLENNSAESSLRSIEIQIKNLEYEYKAAENSYKKSLADYMERSSGIIEQLGNKENSLKALESKLVTEKRKYNQARLSLSYVISTENSITAERNNLLALKYQLIGNLIDYTDLVK